LFQAQLNGKLTVEEERLEDLLTSNVFGSIKYLEPNEGLLPILQSAVDVKGQSLLNSSSRLFDVHYSFWPWLKENECKPCQPDVLIDFMLSDNGKKILLVESKASRGFPHEGIVPFSIYVFSYTIISLVNEL
jgi:hypothetical protein